MDNKFKFSVLMSIYSKENPNYFRDSLDSIVQQTIKPSEIILVEDGEIPTYLLEIINEYKENLKIKTIKLKSNMGLAFALNKGLTECSHEIIIRMDTDDISLPNRFIKQITFMEKNHDISVCSSWIEEMDSTMSKKLSTRVLPTKHEELRRFAKRRNPISHPACIFRKKDVLDAGGYPNIYPEDYPLWSIMIAKGYKLGNIPEVLVQMRTGSDFLKRRGFKFLKGQIQILNLQLKIKTITPVDYAINLCYLTILRLSPLFFKNILYKIAR